MRVSELPSSLRIYIAVHFTALAPLVAVSTAPAGRHQWMLTGALLIGSALASLWRFDAGRQASRMALAFTVSSAALMLQGPFAAVLCAALGTFIGVLLTREPREKASPRGTLLHRAGAFAANAALATAVSAIAFQHTGKLVPDTELGLLAGLTAYTTVFFFLHTGGTALALALEQRLRWREVWTESFLWSAPAFFVASISAFGFEKGLHVSPLVLLFLPPLWIIYRSYRVSFERTRQHTARVEELNRLNQAIIASLATAIDAKDRYNSSHVNRVQHYAVSLAHAAGLKGPDLEAVAIGALVHDIGKLGIPDHILGKPGKLTPEEFRRIQSHVSIGADILSAIPFPFPVVDVVLSHHERWDGQGYPHGLKGEEIPVGGRIIALIDVFDAMTSNRPYRRAKTHQEALLEMRAESGRHFDPRLFHLFEKIHPQCSEEIARSEAAQLRSAMGPASHPGGTLAFSRISQAAAEMAAVSDVAHSLAEHETKQQVSQTVVNRILTLIPGETAVLYMLRDDGLFLDAVAVEGKYRTWAEGHSVTEGKGVVGWVAERQASRVNVPLTQDLARWSSAEEHPDLHAVTGVPLVHGPDTLGVLAVYTGTYSTLSEHHLSVLGIVAEHAACALENIRRMDEHRELACTDPLTGLVNNRGMLRHLERLMFTHGRGKGEFSVVMLDVDGFKEVNDKLGHLRGDDLLREIGRLVSHVSRNDDVPCRYAGDEFVLLLPHANREQAEEVAARLRETMDNIRNVGGSVRIGASVGVATYPEDGDHGRALIQAADARMYEDKFRRRQRSRILPAEEPATEELVA